MIRFSDKYNELRLLTYRVTVVTHYFMRAKTMLYEPQNNAFFDEIDAIYLSFQRLIIEKQLIINQVTKIINVC